VNVAELKAQYRVLADDKPQQPLVSDAQLVYWLNEAEEQACVRARLIAECEEAAVCDYMLHPAQRSYLLHPKVLEIERLFHVNSAGRLSRMGLVTRDWMDRNYPDWLDDAVYPPRLAVQSDTRLTVIGRFAAGEKVHVHCLRLPLQPMQVDDDTPEIHAAHHAALVDWVLYRAFSIRDTESLDPTRGLDALARFTRHFGPAPTARLLRDTRMDVPQLTVPMP